jgi:hypothetical protein
MGSGREVVGEWELKDALRELVRRNRSVFDDRGELGSEKGGGKKKHPLGSSQIDTDNWTVNFRIHSSCQGRCGSLDVGRQWRGKGGGKCQY